MNTRLLSKVKLKQNDVKLQMYLNEGKNEQCFNMSLFVLASNCAGFNQPTIKDFYTYFDMANVIGYVTLDGFVNNIEKLMNFYYQCYFGDKGKLKIIGHYGPEKTIIYSDYTIWNIHTKNGNGHFRLGNYDPWRGGTEIEYIKSIRYVKLMVDL